VTELHAKNGDLDLEKQNLAHQLEMTQAEVETLKQRVNDETLTQVLQNKIDLEKKLQAKHSELVNQRYQFADQIKQLTEHNESLRRQLESVGKQLKAVNDELADLEKARSHDSSESTTQFDLAKLRDRVLAELKLGKQAPGYKVAQKALENFIKLLEP
jgi:chromosome segregation ATPase